MINRITRLRGAVLACLFSLILPLPAWAGALPDAAYTSFTLENDIFTTTNRDRHYTNGLRIAFLSDVLTDFTPDNSSDWMRGIFGSMELVRGEGYERSIAYGIGQIIVTPEDTSQTVAQPDDIPYAGTLYWFYSMNGRRAEQAETLSLLIGIVGPSSMAEESQKTVHQFTGSDRPKGWDNQLKDEPALNLTYDRRYLLSSYRDGEGWDLDLVGIGAMHGGNVLTGGNVSLAAVVGRGGSFDSLAIRPDIMGRGCIAAGGTERTGPFFLAGGGAEFYLYSVFLDGNAFRDGPHVHKKPFAYNGFVGMGYNWLSFSVHMGWITQSRIFREQDKGMEYGTINLTWRN